MYEIACNARGDFIVSINGTYAFLVKRGYARQIVADFKLNSRTGAYARFKRQLGISHSGCKTLCDYIGERLQLPLREVANGPFVHVWSSCRKAERLEGWLPEPVDTLEDEVTPGVVKFMATYRRMYE